MSDYSTLETVQESTRISVWGQDQLFVFLKEDDTAKTQNSVNAYLSFTCYIEEETNLHCKA